MDLSIKPLPEGIRALPEEEAETVRASEDWDTREAVLSRYNCSDAQMNSETMAAATRPAYV